MFLRGRLGCPGSPDVPGGRLGWRGCPDVAARRLGRPRNVMPPITTIDGWPAARGRAPAGNGGPRSGSAVVALRDDVGMGLGRGVDVIVRGQGAAQLDDAPVGRVQAVLEHDDAARRGQRQALVEQLAGPFGQLQLVQGIAAVAAAASVPARPVRPRRGCAGRPASRRSSRPRGPWCTPGCRRRRRWWSWCLSEKTGDRTQSKAPAGNRGLGCSILMPAVSRRF